MIDRGAKLGREELELLKYIADRHPATVREVADHFGGEAGKARTTVMTVMERLRKKGFLTRRKVEGVYRYEPRQDKAELLRALVRDFVAGALGGSVAPFVAYLAREATVTDAELADLKRLVGELESRRAGGGDEP